MQNSGEQDVHQDPRKETDVSPPSKEVSGVYLPSSTVVDNKTTSWATMMEDDEKRGTVKTGAPSKAPSKKPSPKAAAKKVVAVPPSAVLDPQLKSGEKSTGGVKHLSRSERKQAWIEKNQTKQKERAANPTEKQITMDSDFLVKLVNALKSPDPLEGRPSVPKPIAKSQKGVKGKQTKQSAATPKPEHPVAGKVYCEKHTSTDNIEVTPKVQEPPSKPVVCSSVTVSGSSVKRATFADRARGYAVKIGKNERVASKLKSLGVNFKEEGYADSNQHAVSAAVRNVAVTRALSKCGGRILLDYYGSARTMKIVTDINEAVDDKIKYLAYRPIVTSADANRTIPVEHQIFTVDHLEYQDVLCTDVYEDTTSDTGEFSPDVVGRLIPDPGQRLFWIGYNFSDPAGSNFEENAWIKNDAGEVLFSPDEGNPMYGPHPPCKWIWESKKPIEVGECTIGWSLDRYWEGYTVVMFTNFGKMQVIQQRMNFMSQWLTKSVTHDKLSFWSLLVGKKLATRFMAPEEVTKKVTVPAPVWLAVIKGINNADKTKMSLKQTRTIADAALLSSKEFKLIERRFPDAVQSYVREIADVAFNLSSQEGVESHMFTVMGNDNHKLNVELSSTIGKAERVDQPQVPLGPLVIGTIGLTAVVTTALAYLVSKVGSTFQRRTRASLYELGEEMTNYISVNGTSPDLKPLWEGCDSGTPVLETVWTCLKNAHGNPFSFLGRSIIAPLMEETIKFILRKIGGDSRWFALAELIASVCMAPVAIRQQMLLVRLMPFIFHLLIEKYDWSDRVLLHSLYNSGVVGMPLALCFSAMGCKVSDYKSLILGTTVISGALQQMLIKLHFSAGVAPCAMLLGMELTATKNVPPPAKIGWEEFRRNFYVESWENRVPWEEQTSVEKFPPELAFVPAQDKSYFEKKEQNPKFTLITKINDPGSVGPNRGCYCLLPTNVHGYVPSNSESNLISVFEARLNAKPPMEAAIQNAAWDKISDYVSIVPKMSPLIHEELCESWLQHFDGQKRKKYETCFKQMTEDTYLPLKKGAAISNVIVKCDEWLIKADNDGIVMKPRAIINVNPLVQSQIGPTIYAATNRLKRLWDVRNPYIHGDVTFAYGAGVTDSALSAWMWATLGLPDKWHIIVAGDDLLIINHAKNMYIEGDASMFDQSQAQGPIVFEHLVLENLGVPPEVIRLSMKVSASNFVGYSHAKEAIVFLDRGGEMGRLSGHSDTSLGNSIVMAFSAFTAIKNLGRTTWKESFGLLGLNMKIKSSPTLYDVTFLKGMWYKCDDTPVWGPLPSRILKVGKSLRDPRNIYHIADFELAAQRFLNDVACGHNYFLQVPVLRVFVRNFMKNDEIKSLVQLDASQQFKTQASGLCRKYKIDDWENVYLRYDTTAAEVEELENMIPSTPFQFLQHPLLRKLAVDYA